MLRAVLLVGPLVLVVAVSCSSSDSANFSDTAPPGNDAGTSATTGGTSSTGGSNASAGSNATGGTNSAGSSSTAGKGNTAGTTNTAGTSTGTGGTGTGGTGSGGTGTAGKASDAGAPGDAGATSAGAPTGAAGDGAGGSPTGALCVDVVGTYTIKNADGFCDGLNKDATQSITGGAESLCDVHFVSAVQEGGQGVNGPAQIDGNGGFKATPLFLNKTQREPCVGTWEPNNERMTIKCGGPGDLCTVLLERN